MVEVIAIDHHFFSKYRWGVIDASYRADLPDAWRPRVIAPRFLGNDSERCPVLIDLQALPEGDGYTLLDRVAAGGDGPLSLALESDAQVERLLSHLRERLEIRDGAGEPPRQFRYYDPGTFLQLPQLLGDVGMRWLLGPVTAVAVPWCGEWSRYLRPNGVGTPSFNLRDRLPELLRLSAVNRALVCLSVVGQDDWCRKARITGQHIERAEAHGLAQRDDLVAFALHAWLHHPHFDDHPTIQRLLKEFANSAPEDELDYRELSARLEDGDWQKIAGDLNAKEIREGIHQ